jgi:hypothetical protein
LAGPKTRTCSREIGLGDLVLAQVGDCIKSGAAAELEARVGKSAPSGASAALGSAPASQNVVSATALTGASIARFCTNVRAARLRARTSAAKPR